MAILSRTKLSPQQRFDLEDWLAEQASARTDAKLSTQRFLAANNLILNGFAVSGLGLNTATVAMANAALIIPQNTSDFSYFIAAPAEPNITVTDAQLVDNARNFIEVELTTQDGVPLSKAFWDPEANSGLGSEFNQTVNTVTDVRLSVVVLPGGFSGSPNRLPIAIIDTNASGVIKVILDRRELYGRLAKPGNLNYGFPWSTKLEPTYALVMTGVVGTFVAGETLTIGTETATAASGGTSSIAFRRPSGISFATGASVTGGTSGATGTVDTIIESFTGADKSLAGQKSINDAIMTEIRNLKGTPEWYSDSFNSNNGLTNLVNSVMVQAVAGANWVWSGTALSITDPAGSPADADVLGNIRILGDSRTLNLTRQDGTGGSTTLAIGDGQVLYVELPLSGTRAYSGLGSGPTNYKVVARTAYVPSDTNYWIALRQGSSLYIRNQGGLESGESEGIGDNVPQSLLDNLGLLDEVTPPSYSSNIRGTAGQSLVGRIGVLTDAVGDEQEDRSGYFRSNDPVVWTGTQLEFTQPIILEFVNTKTGTITQHSILAAASPITLVANESIWIEVDRTAATENVTANKSSVLPIPAQVQADKDVFVLGRRVDVGPDGYLHIPFHKQVLEPGQAVRLGASGAGSGGLTKVKLHNVTATTLPTGVSAIIDGVTVVNDDLVLFTNLSSGNNRVYKVGGVGVSLTWTVQNIFAGNSPTATNGDLIVVANGLAFTNQIGAFDAAGPTWRFNDTIRLFNGPDFLEISSLKTKTVNNNQVSADTIFSVAAANSEHLIVDYSLLRGSTHETGTLYITQDTVTVSLAQIGANIGALGVVFSAAIAGPNLIVSYTSSNTGTAATMKYSVRRWADAGAGPTGVPTYTSPVADLIINNANILWTPEGGGSLGQLAGNRPTGVHALNTLSVGGETYRIRQASVSTTDATVTTIQDVVIPVDSAMLLEVRVVGRRTGGTSGSAGDCATYVLRCRVKNIAGTVTIHDLTSEESEDQIAWDADVTAVGANARIRVRGAADNNVSWTANIISQGL